MLDGNFGISHIAGYQLPPHPAGMIPPNAPYGMPPPVAHQMNQVVRL